MQLSFHFCCWLYGLTMNSFVRNSSLRTWQHARLSSNFRFAQRSQSTAWRPGTGPTAAWRLCSAHLRPVVILSTLQEWPPIVPPYPPPSPPPIRRRKHDSLRQQAVTHLTIKMVIFVNFVNFHRNSVHQIGFRSRKTVHTNERR